jgi:hypothetical protein
MGCDYYRNCCFRVYAVELFALSVPVFVVLGRVMQFPADRCADYTQLT